MYPCILIIAYIKSTLANVLLRIYGLIGVIMSTELAIKYSTQLINLHEFENLSIDNFYIVVLTYISRIMCIVIAVIRLSTLAIRLGTTLTITFQRRSTETFAGTGTTSTISISPYSNYTSSDNILAYRQNYQDPHRSGNLAVIFINLGAVYPCISSFRDISCTLLSNEDDGFHGGRAIYEAADDGGNFEIFGSTPTFAFAFEGCTALITTCPSIPDSFLTEYYLVCYLPRSRCSNVL